VTLTHREYAVVLDPYGADGVQRLGAKEMRKGEQSFFLRPGERLEGGQKQEVLVLAEDEALLLRANEAHEDRSDPAMLVWGPRGENGRAAGPASCADSVGNFDSGSESDTIKVPRAAKLSTGATVPINPCVRHPGDT
jgi:hypothetical protein